MALQEEFERSGEWLFRWRSYIPLLLTLVVLAALPSFTYPEGSHGLDTAWDILCLGVAFFGLAIRIYTVGHVPDRTSGRNTRGQVASHLNTTGMYSLMRHPLYFGNFWIWIGVSLFPRVWWCTFLIGLGLLFFYERVMFAEERFLRATFGEAFAEWANRTPAFWPRFRNWQPPALPFSWRMALRREYSGLFAIIASLTFLEVVGTGIVEHRFELEPFWAVLFFLGLASYLALRTLKKKHLLEPRKEPAENSSALE